MSRVDHDASPSGDRAAGLRPQPPTAFSRSSIPSAGDVFAVAYPFIRGTYSALTNDGYEDVQTWTPGVRYEPLPPYGEDAGAVADALGSMTLTVVDCFKPGRYPARVFYTRHFTSPHGARFGKPKLHIATVEKFRRLASGYKHPFGIGEPLPPRWSVADARRDFEELLAAHPAQGMETREGGDGEAAPSRSDDSPVRDSECAPSTTPNPIGE